MNRAGNSARRSGGGRQHYFGPYAKAAPKEYTRVAEFLEKGLEPPPREGDCLTLVRLCNVFIESANAKLHADEITARTYAEYERTCERLMEHFGKKRVLTPFRPRLKRATLFDTNG